MSSGNPFREVELNGGADDIVNAYEGAGVTWSVAQGAITKVEWINGSYSGDQNGVFTANFKLQVTTDGSTWTDATGWSLSPAYNYDTPTAGGATYTFTGSQSGVLGMRVVGQVFTSGSYSWHSHAREMLIYQ